MKHLFVLSAGAAATLILFFSCSLPSMTSSATSASTGSGGTTTSLSVTTDGNQGVLVTPGGRLDIAAVGSDGVKVSCAVPSGVTRLGGNGKNGPAVILGKTSTGAPGIWIYDKGNIEAPWNEDTGRHSSLLGESDEHDGMLKGHFGWSYTQMGSAEGADSKIMVGVAENKKGFTIGKFSIDPGTTVGVYWMIWKDRHGRHFVVSNARIIGVLASDDSHHDSWWHHHRFDRFFHRFEMLKAFLTGTLTSYLTAVDENGVSYDTKSSNYIVSGSDGSNDPADAAINEHGQVLSIAANTKQSSSVDLTVSAITPSAYSIAQSTSTTTSQLPVSFNVENLGNTAVTSSFTVNLYVAPSSTFSTSGTPAATITVPSIGAQGTVSESNVPVTIPSTLTSNENVYIYADVVAPSGTTDSNPSNNVSTPTQAAVVLTYNDSGATPYYYPLIVETYGTTGGSSNPGISLFKLNSSGTSLMWVRSAVSNQSNNAYNSIDFSTQGSYLPSGTYYLAVFPLMQSGPYAVDVRSSGVTPLTFNALTADPSGATNIVASGGAMVVDGSNYTSYKTPVPTVAQQINVGSALNWYLNGSDLGGTDATEWFTFTLP